MRAVAVVIIATLSTVTVATGQTGPRTDFDVASVKPAVPNRPASDFMRDPSPGQWRLFGATVHDVIINIYPEHRLPGLVVGGPAWGREIKFDLQGRMNPATSPAQVKTMVQRLLDARFGLRTHIEKRTLDVFVLTPVQPGKLGPGMTPAAPACVEWRRNGGDIPEGCDARRRVGVTSGSTLSAATIAELILFYSLSAMMRLPNAPIDRPIIDRTGLEGYFDMVGPSAMAGGRGLPASEPEASFFTLIQEQLGLKLTRAREMVDVLVIDSVSMPEPD
jgi:uncharacterized protein (TIGR03435 family)